MLMDGTPTAVDLWSIRGADGQASASFLASDPVVRVTRTYPLVTGRLSC
jgi:hypothetical protein